MDPWFITAFADGDCCFYISKIKNCQLKIGWQTLACFEIDLDAKDKVLLDRIQAYFGVGNVYKAKRNTCRYMVRTLKDLAVIIDHFDKYPLITSKWSDFELFKQVVDLINRKEHLTFEGLQQIVNLRASINNGLSSKLKEAFPDTIPVQRPIVNDQVIKDPNWLVGFTIYNQTKRMALQTQWKNRFTYYNSISEAAIALNCNHTSIIYNLKSKKQHPYKGRYVLNYL
jgi:hypothetical protein